MIKEALSELALGRDLDVDSMVKVMDEIMSGEATTAQIGAFLMGLRNKGETVDEITGAARVMREKAKKISPPGPCIDTCGTGGDNSLTFNISTTAAFVVAGGGVVVAKHGNRAASSASGSADVLSALGVNIEATPETVEKCLKEVGIGFLFAPSLHGAMRFAIGPRRELGFRTIFNVLGPLTNPAGASRQLLGVFSPDLTEVMAKVLGNLGSEAALVVHGLDGLDEVTLTGPTRVSELKDGKVTTYEINPEDFGIDACHRDDLLGGDPQENARLTLEVLKGREGRKLDITAMNAGAALYAAGLADSIADGIKKAYDIVASGKAMEKLDSLIEASRE